MHEFEGDWTGISLSLSLSLSPIPPPCLQTGAYEAFFAAKVFLKYWLNGGRMGRESKRAVVALYAARTCSSAWMDRRDASVPTLCPKKGARKDPFWSFFFFGERKANLRTCVSAVSESGKSFDQYVTRLLCREKSTIWIIGWYFWIACLNRVPRSLFFLPWWVYSEKLIIKRDIDYTQIFCEKIFIYRSSRTNAFTFFFLK